MLDLSVNNGRQRAPYAYPMLTMGERIKFLREARGLTQAQVAKACGVSKGAVSHWELGVTANIKLVTFLKLLDVLRTDYEYLVFGASRAAAQPAHEPQSDQVRKAEDSR